MLVSLFGISYIPFMSVSFQLAALGVSAVARLSRARKSKKKHAFFHSFHVVFSGRWGLSRWLSLFTTVVGRKVRCYQRGFPRVACVTYDGECTPANVEI